MLIPKPDLRLSRSEVRSFPCPACDAAPGARCVGARDKPRESNHQERVDLAIAHELRGEHHV